MLRFTKPGSIASSLHEALIYLLQDLLPLMGYPANIELVECPQPAPQEVVTSEDGSFRLLLGQITKKKVAFYLLVSAEAAQDRQARVIVNRFARLCRKISENDRAWDVKALLIREEQFLWDNLVVSLSHSGNQKYNALDVLQSVRESLMFRYEGQQTDSGVLVTWNWHSLQPLLRERGSSILKFKKPFDLRDNLRTIKATHMLSDGSTEVAPPPWTG